jgi:K+-transporting ATPase KdpF subunit
MPLEPIAALTLCVALFGYLLYAMLRPERF